MNRYLFTAIFSCVINLIVILPTNATEEPEPLPRVNITFPANNVTTAPPTLYYSVSGESSDTVSINCEVYLRINNGDSELVSPDMKGNYSSWSYFSSDNSTLNVGQNNLTASYVCPNDPSSTANNSTVFTVDPNNSTDIFGPIYIPISLVEELPSTGGERLENPTK